MLFTQWTYFYPWTGLCYSSNLNLTLIFRKTNSLLVFCFWFLLNYNFNPAIYFFLNNDYVIRLGVFFYIFEIITNYLNPLNIQRWVDCKCLIHKFVQNLRSLINLAWIFSFLQVSKFFLLLKISHFNTLKQVYWLTKASQGQVSFIFLVEWATIDTKNLKLKMLFTQWTYFYPWTGLCYSSNLNLTLIFRKTNSLLVFCFWFLLNYNFNPAVYFFRNNDYVIRLGVFFYIFEIMTNYLNPLII